MKRGEKQEPEIFELWSLFSSACVRRDMVDLSVAATEKEKS
jgi:hypothetical protein